jgi:hypothetical protein
VKANGIITATDVALIKSDVGMALLQNRGSGPGTRNDAGKPISEQTTPSLNFKFLS